MTPKLASSTALHAHAQPSRLSRAWKAVTNKIGNVLVEGVVAVALTTTLAFAGCGDQAARNLTDAQSDGHLDGKGEVYDGGSERQDAGVKCKEWTKIYTEGNDNWGNGIATDSNGNLYAIGTAYYNSPYPIVDSNVWLRKLNPDGKEVFLYEGLGFPCTPTSFTNLWGEGTGIAVANTNTIFVGGGMHSDEDDCMWYAYFRPVGPLDKNLYESEGYTYNPTDFLEGIQAITADSEGNAYMTGHTSVHDGGDSESDLWLGKFVFQPDGTTLGSTWERTYDSPVIPSWDGGRDVAVDSKGNVYVVGFVDWLDDGLNASSIMIRKYNANGDFVRFKAYGGEGGALGVAIDAEDNLYVVGYNGSIDFWMNKLDADLNDLWPMPIIGTGAIGDSLGNAVAVDGANNVYVTGGSDSSNGEWVNVWTRKMTPNGEEIWTRTYNGKNNLYDQGYNIALGPDGSVYVIGIEGWQILGGSTNALILKYCNTE